MILLAAVLALSSVTASGDSSAESKAMLRSWFDAVGAPKPEESFGSYVARAAYVKHGVRYDDRDPRLPAGGEEVRIELERFECVSFIESSLALARCGWEREPTVSCFEREIVLSRYRGGILSSYASRLHYFAEWISDNDARGRVANITTTIGGEPLRKDFFYVSRRVLSRADPRTPNLDALRLEMRAVEERLSAREHVVLLRERAREGLARLEDGDVIAFVREREGLLVHHAGFVYRVGGRPRLLHASSFHQRVVLTPDDVTSYLLRRPERRGVIVARPAQPMTSR
jgi:hypothetical protein